MSDTLVDPGSESDARPIEAPIERLHPIVQIGKPEVPALFLDTFFWAELLAEPASSDVALLRRACADGLLQVVATSLLAGELKQRRLMDRVKELCAQAFVEIPLDRISLNQAIQALIRYIEKHQKVNLGWGLMISDPPVDTPAVGLRSWVADFAVALNADKAENPRSTKESWCFSVAWIERNFWSDRLKSYGEILGKWYNNEDRTYERFFSTDYFLDLPFVVLKAYYLGDILGQRPVKPQDIVDVYSIAELLPYTSLYVMDNDQHDRWHNIFRRYPSLLSEFDVSTAIRSCLSRSEDPRVALRSFLEGIA
jgi:hypothetical protein